MTNFNGVNVLSTYYSLFYITEKFIVGRFLQGSCQNHIGCGITYCQPEFFDKLFVCQPHVVFWRIKKKVYSTVIRNSCGCQHWMKQFTTTAAALAPTQFIFATVLRVILKWRTVESNRCTISARMYLLILLLICDTMKPTFLIIC